MKKINVSIIDKTTLRLEEDANKGDIIDLNLINSLNTVALEEAIINGKDAFYEKKLAEMKTNLELAAKSQQQANEHILENKILELKEQLKLQENKELIKLKDQEMAYQRQIQDKNKELEIIKNEVNTIKQTQQQALELEIMKVKETFNASLQDKNTKIEKLNLQSQLDYASLDAKWQKELNSKQSELDALRNAKSSLQVKMLGEELEKWCNSEYENFALSGFSNAKWYKDSEVVRNDFDEKGTKADYIFEVYANDKKSINEQLLKVVCEMKSESPDSKNKQKNANHFAKLDKDRHKKNAQYALLVSELEWDTANDAPIKKINEYENMYLVRPPYFMTFLSLINALAIKYQTLILDKSAKEVNFKESQAILNDFENLKRTYLDNPLASLEKDVIEIKKQAESTYKSASKILELSDKIITNRISEMKVKIERLNIVKIINRVEGLNK